MGEELVMFQLFLEDSAEENALEEETSSQQTLTIKYSDFCLFDEKPNLIFI